MTAGVPNQNQGREHADESLLPEAGNDVNAIETSWTSSISLFLGQRHEDIFQRRSDGVDVGMWDAGLGQLPENRLPPASLRIACKP